MIDDAFGPVRELIHGSTALVSQEVYEHYRKLQQERVDHLRELQKMLRNPPPDQQPDWDSVGTKWLDMIRPVWFERLSEYRNRPLLLKDIRNDLLADPEHLITQLEAHFAQFPVLRRPEERIKACIIGVPLGE